MVEVPRGPHVYLWVRGARISARGPWVPAGSYLAPVQYTAACCESVTMTVRHGHSGELQRVIPCGLISSDDSQPVNYRSHMTVVSLCFQQTR